MGPIDDGEPAELWLKLCEPAPSEVIDFPRKDRNGKPVGKIRIKVLKMEDHNKARIKATKALKDAVKASGVGELDKVEMETEAIREVLGDLIAHELLCMACYTDKEQLTDEKTGEPIYGKVFATPGHIRQVLTADETLVLFKAYQLVQHKYGPFELTIQDDRDIEAWINRLKEGGSAFPLTLLPFPQLAELTFALSEKISMVCQLLESQLSNLPPTLVSDLQSCFLDTSLFGGQPSLSTQSYEEISQKSPVKLHSALQLSQQHKDTFRTEER